MKNPSKRNPLHYTPKIKKRLVRLIKNLRNDVEYVVEPKAQALFETSAEVLIGAGEGPFVDYEKKTERAWADEPELVEVTGRGKFPGELHSGVVDPVARERPGNVLLTALVSLGPFGFCGPSSGQVCSPNPLPP